MNKIKFHAERSVTTPTNDSAIVLENEDPHEALIDAMIQSVSTRLFFTAGGITLFLAAWQDPDHWGQEWQEAGVDGDPYDFIYSLTESDE